MGVMTWDIDYHTSPKYPDPQLPQHRITATNRKDLIMRYSIFIVVQHSRYYYRTRAPQLLLLPLSLFQFILICIICTFLLFLQPSGLVLVVYAP
jgi:hypothetical protein